MTAPLAKPDGKKDMKVLTAYMVDSIISSAPDGEGPIPPCGCLNSDAALGALRQVRAETGIRHASSGERARYGAEVLDGLWVRFMRCPKCGRRWEGQPKP